jgi:MoCo/4Fe-4S cofactor protein with predicted Tat translocation signal
MKHVFQHPPETPSPTGRKYWRTMGELNDTPEFRGWLEREFPAGIDELETDGLSRRSFLQLMGGSLALAGFGLSGCRRPEAFLVPFAKSAEWTIPGNNLLYATSMPRRNGALPLIVTTTDGRPIKNEGNPLHPVSNGGTDTYAQASILELYDPERSRAFALDGKASDAAAFADWVSQLRAEAKADGGASLAILTGESMSPTRERLRAELQQQFPKMTWCVYEPLSNDNEREATKAAFGSVAMKVTPKFAKADVILALDSDFLCIEDGGIAASRDFASRRRVAASTDSMNRLYAVENRYTITGGMADHRLRCPASQIGAVTVAFAKAVADATSSGPLTDMLSTVPATEVQKLEKSLPWITEAAKDLVDNRGKCLVVVGANQPGWVHALGFAINGALGNFGTTLTAISTAAPAGASLGALADKMKSGAVKALFVFGGNPAYNAPTDLNWPELQKKVANVVRLGLFEDETSVGAKWHVPAAHYLESWGDDRSSDGTYVAVQPMILPLHGGVSELEVMAALAGREKVEGPQLIQETFKTIAKNVSDEALAWNSFLREGFLANSAAAEANATFNAGGAKSYLQTNFKSAPVPAAEAMEVVLTPDYSVWDGRYANNGWMQELADPVTKLTWDNAALMSPATATKLGLTWREDDIRDGKGTGVYGDWIEIAVGDRKVKAAVLVDPGHVDNSVSLSLGYGREVVGRIGRDAGFNAYPLRSSGALYFVSGAKVAKVAGDPYVFSTTQHHYNMEGRALVRELPLETYREHPGFGEDGKSFVQKFGMDAHIPPSATIYNHPKLEAEQQWGMAIDLNTCTGCSACVVACQSENNIPIVGKHQVRRGRIMQWIRMDRYYSSASANDEDPQVMMQPVTCHHCENAPCETVCPVNATVHNEEGLNVMAYNRCIGTRYCANNCPYKVRRFNYFDYNSRPLDKLYLGPLAHKGVAETIQLSKNPNVTVRMRGVMEKCTFCVQRIEEAKIGQLRIARDSNNTKVPTNQIKTACQQVCPSEAIVFGDIKDPNSTVSKLKKRDLNYTMLDYLNIQPRLSYLARLRNPNPKMPGAAAVGMSTLKDAHGHAEPAHH